MKRLALLALLLAACDDDGGGTPDAAPPSGDTPEIRQVRWFVPGACGVGSPANITFVVEAVDGDTPAGELHYAGSLPTCTPPTWSTTSATQIVNCPNASLIRSTVEVRDPEGHAATLSFDVPPCANGSAP